MTKNSIPEDDGLVHIHASNFRKPLRELAEVLAQKVKREAPHVLSAPGYISHDLHVLVRQACYTYDLLFYINADERRENDCDWKPVYTIVTSPLVRTMIDCLYNITAILEDPREKGVQFRISGLKKTLAGLDEEEKRYEGRPEWDDYIKAARDQISVTMRSCRISGADLQKCKKWPTMGQYLSEAEKSGALTAYQSFLKTLTYKSWREYSALAHASAEAFIDVGMYYTYDSQPHEDRPKIDKLHLRILSLHLGRAAAILLCIVTELQAYFRFDGADINDRIQTMWNTLMPVPEVKELFSERYEHLIRERVLR